MVLSRFRYFLDNEKGCLAISSDSLRGRKTDEIICEVQVNDTPLRSDSYDSSGNGFYHRNSGRRTYAVV